MSKVIDNIEDIASIDSKVIKVTSTDNAVVIFDGTTGQVQNSGVIITDSGDIKTTMDGLTIRDSNGESQLNITKSNGSDNASVSIGSSGADAGSKTGLFRVFTNNTERMRINSSGNLLVGTTTDNGVDKLQVNGSISASKINSAINLEHRVNVDYTGSNRTVYVTIPDCHLRGSVVLVDISGHRFDNGSSRFAQRFARLCMVEVTNIRQFDTITNYEFTVGTVGPVITLNGYDIPSVGKIRLNFTVPAVYTCSFTVNVTGGTYTEQVTSTIV